MSENLESAGVQGRQKKRPRNLAEPIVIEQELVSPETKGSGQSELAGGEPSERQAPSLKKHGEGSLNIAAGVEKQGSEPRAIQPEQNRAGTNGQVIGDSIVNRRSRWYSSLTAFRYVRSLSKDEDVRIRDSDRITGIFLLVAAGLTGLSLLLPQLAAHRLAFVLASDSALGTMLVLYVVNRFGILSTLNARQALLSWQLMMGAAFLGIFITINMAVAIALVVANTVSR